MMLQAHATSICSKQCSSIMHEHMLGRMPRTDGRTEKNGDITHVRHKSPVSVRARKTGISSQADR